MKNNKHNKACSHLRSYLAVKPLSGAGRMADRRTRRLKDRNSVVSRSIKDSLS